MLKDGGEAAWRYQCCYDKRGDKRLLTFPIARISSQVGLEISSHQALGDLTVVISTLGLRNVGTSMLGVDIPDRKVPSLSFPFFEGSAASSVKEAGRLGGSIDTGSM